MFEITLINPGNVATVVDDKFVLLDVLTCKQSHNIEGLRRTQLSRKTAPGREDLLVAPTSHLQILTQLHLPCLLLRIHLLVNLSITPSPAPIRITIALHSPTYALLLVEAVKAAFALAALETSQAERLASTVGLAEVRLLFFAGFGAEAGFGGREFQEGRLVEFEVDAADRIGSFDMVTGLEMIADPDRGLVALFLLRLVFLSDSLLELVEVAERFQFLYGLLDDEGVDVGFLPGEEVTLEGGGFDPFE